MAGCLRCATVRCACTRPPRSSCTWATGFPTPRWPRRWGRWSVPTTYRWLVYLTNTLHTAYTRWYAPWYMPDTPELGQSIRDAGARDIGDCLDFIDGHLNDRPYLIGERFSGADLLLHMLESPNWSLDLAPAVFTRPNLGAHHARVDERPAVQRMKAIHGLDWNTG